MKKWHTIVQLINSSFHSEPNINFMLIYFNNMNILNVLSEIHINLFYKYKCFCFKLGNKIFYPINHGHFWEYQKCDK